VKKIKAVKAAYDLSICAVPLLFETELDGLFDVVVTISCDKDAQKERLSERGWSKEDIEGRLSRQFSMEKKEELADYVISNIGDLEFFKRQCQILIEDWKQFPVNS
jgi:dephospho-CoA kinase